MQNLARIGKGILLFIIMLMVVDLVWFLYTYITSVRAMEDTLSSIALIVAEDNCIDKGTGNIEAPSSDSKLYSVQELMVENATAWLCYNNNGFDTTSSDSNRRWRSANHTDIQTDDCRDVTLAMNNIDMNYALNLNGADNGDMYSYVDCPQRGQSIPITLQAKINVHLLSFIPSWGNISVPITRETTVIGMKFYKGKG